VAASTSNGWEPGAEQAEFRVLFVDDDPLMRRTVRRHLAPHGAEVIAVAFATHVEPLLASGRFDAVLCDYHLGEERTSGSLVRKLCAEHRKVAVLTSNPDGARSDSELEGVPVLSKADFGRVVEWLREPVTQERPVATSHEREKVGRLPAEPSRPSVSKLAIEAPVVPQEATPVELAAYEEMELPDPRDAHAASERSYGAAPDAPTREMHSAPRLRAIEAPEPGQTPTRGRAPVALAFVLGVGVGGGGVAAALWLAGALG